MRPLKPGDKAPAFTLPGEKGKIAGTWYKVSPKDTVSEKICGITHLRPAASGGQYVSSGGTVSKSTGMAPETLTRILASGEINEANRGQTGGKAYALWNWVRDRAFNKPESEMSLWLFGLFKSSDYNGC